MPGCDTRPRNYLLKEQENALYRLEQRVGCLILDAFIARVSLPPESVYRIAVDGAFCEVL